ncbi:MAG: Uncharacterized protein XD63_0029 [Thermoanaerobacterales bacterium 50_218]|nr:MAG: Uncharacterized protein XD63_0029 [Thermoanaerobacterales bacterium 50_218]HAA90270.1 hypothetical protein [Peptococcaceae bacterium]
MTLRSVDLQVLLPRVQEAGRIQQIHQANEQTQQQSFAAHLLREAEVAQRSVQNLPQAREGMIKERERREGRSSQSGQREKKSPKKEKEGFGNSGDFDNCQLGQNIDFKI